MPPITILPFASWSPHNSHTQAAIVFSTARKGEQIGEADGDVDLRDLAAFQNAFTSNDCRGVPWFVGQPMAPHGKHRRFSPEPRASARAIVRI